MASRSVNTITLVAGQGEIGGGEQMLLRMGEAAQLLGYEVSVVGPSWGELAEACAKLSISYVAVRGGSRRSFGVSAAAHLQKRHLGLVWANGAMPALAATTTPNKLVVHLHQHPSMNQARAIWAAKRRAGRIIVPSEAMRAKIRGSSVMLNWTEELTPLTRAPEVGAFTIAYLGRLSIDKGVDVLAAATDRMARDAGELKVRLLLGGDTRFVSKDAASRVRRALDSCTAEVVEMGWVEPRKVLALADVVVVPSRWHEPFGLVAAEAMAMGCPLIVSDAGALPEVVGSEYPWIFPAGSIDGLVLLLARAWADGPPDTGELRQRWEERFSPIAGVERMSRILRSMRTL